MNLNNFVISLPLFHSFSLFANGVKEAYLRRLFFDIKLVCADGSNFYAHSLVLSLFSDFFAEKASRNENTFKEIDLGGVNSGSFTVLIWLKIPYDEQGRPARLRLSFNDKKNIPPMKPRSQTCRRTLYSYCFKCPVSHRTRQSPFAAHLRRERGRSHVQLLGFDRDCKNSEARQVRPP